MKKRNSTKLFSYRYKLKDTNKIFAANVTKKSKMMKNQKKDVIK